MVLIRDSKGRRKDETPSGYERLTGNKKLGQLLSRCHATVISAGNELERVLENKLTGRNDVAIGNLNKEKRVFKNLKEDSIGKKHDIKIDTFFEKNDEIILVELKDGDTFDTKKAAGEIESLNIVKKYLENKGKKVSVRFCSFNARDHEQIEKGAKGLLEKGMAMTGKELCEMLELDFDKIVEERKKDQKENLNAVAKEIKDIPELIEKLKD
jgi:hypothetical protein